MIRAATTTAQHLRRATFTSTNATRLFATDAATSGKMTLNFSLPHETIYTDTKVAQVIIPGAAGDFGVTADHVPTVAQVKPGVIQIQHDESDTTWEKYFVVGGFAITHKDSTTDISCPEAVKVDDIDSTAVSANFEKAKSALAAAEAGSVAAAEAQIEMVVNGAMGSAVGLTLA